MTGGRQFPGGKRLPLLRSGHHRLDLVGRSWLESECSRRDVIVRRVEPLSEAICHELRRAGTGRRIEHGNASLSAGNRAPILKGATLVD